MMDYKKAYYSLIERLKEAKEDDVLCDERYCCVIDGLIQEPEECEDEKTRKEIIDYIKTGTYKKDWIAWLEKQNTSVEINPTEFDTRLQNLIGRFKDLPKDDLVGSLSFWLNVVQNDGTYKDEEPNDTFCKKNCKGYQEIGKGISDGDCDAKIKAEKNIVWSEGDDFRTRTLIDVVKNVCSIRPELRNEFIGWLKTIKYRIAPQQKEWSKEDERNLQNIDSVLFREISLSEDECMRLRDWLQFIKERATWKPTENELRVLKLAAEKDGTCLMGLYEQLKKL